MGRATFGPARAHPAARPPACCAPNHVAPPPSPPTCVQAKFTIFGPEELSEKSKEEVARVVDLLCISDAEATRVLRAYK